MKTIYRFIYILALSVAGFSASAQDLDPTVVVDRAYEGKLMEVHKPSLEMAVPDSVMRFDLDFDYSVFDSPYKGSYEFNPYLLSMKPSAATDDSGRFFLRAGAGYQLRPEFDMVWSSRTGESVRVDVYGRHRSYIGNYQNVSGSGDQVWKGYDMDTKAGILLGSDWENGALSLDVGYVGLHQKDISWHRAYNGVDASFAVASKEASAKGMTYAFDADYRYAADMTYVKSSGSRKIGEHNLDVGLKIGSGLRKGGAFRVDLGLSMAGYDGRVDCTAADIYVIPRYLYRKGVFSADLGLKLSKLVTDTLATGFTVAAKDQIVYPDVELRLNLLPKYLALFAKAGGGNTINSYSSILEGNHHANVSVPGMTWEEYTGPEQQPVSRTFGYKMGATIERISLTAGLEGRIGARFSYALYGGYARYAAGMLDAVRTISVPGMNYESAVAGLEYKPYSKLYAVFDWLWKDDRFMADGKVMYVNASGDAFSEGSSCVAPAAVTGDVSFEYNYRRRIFVGVDCIFSSARTAGNGYYVIPGYADLGLAAEYVTSRALSFWARGGNLLGMTIQRNPLYAVKGPYFTLGISLKL